ncbi:hypothetical protein [Dinghuibacter silviterrae]|uniref:Uncharacterized protein n=1 Tax=Dinghuibacter silviterrae TaxID=1539049 RepID=A0A4R8DQR3_9BACT|nr:hypothetical protein [Dinghuibacter silviterrae]TDX00492.1 hypothetical protein EDB95_1517 [Dinghuibacter silviterrae]
MINETQPKLKLELKSKTIVTLSNKQLKKVWGGVTPEKATQDPNDTACATYDSCDACITTPIETGCLTINC